ncbi:hypothetical protein LTR78_004036 [Recurvomyces mirabilis]|uniref:Transcription factor Iwr1 domain-containing protein n=1 Tax=Recurvomyces mirabilis TaxID=574656 RepID=A0AAE1C322_9PEZI|nr:hypothetical protein LTR78_004036 [Recurvomyces mirabilis]KAK5153826.1 hypothetical protein LTS14_007045 [Recurvomyces mirabilis]
MSSGPSQLLVKRKRDEPGPDKLILEPPTKKTLTVGAAAQSNALQYVRVDRELGSKAKERQDGTRDGDGVRGHGGEVQAQSQSKRVFHLSRRQGEGTVRRNLQKRKQTGGATGSMFATFEESSARNAKAQSRPGNTGSDAEDREEGEVAPLKRPGRRLAVARTGSVSKQLQTNESTETRSHAEALATSMQRFANEELAEPPKQKITSLPKFATRRRDLHPQPAPVQASEPRIRDDEMDVDSDGDYVYDTYILAPPSTESQANGTGADLVGDNVGYLVINDEDQALWEAYIEDEPSDKDWDSDDADSNAEDYYGADYPEDELASDDEYDRGAYGYRRHGASDDESWDEDTGAFSGDEEEDTAPWKNKTYGRLAKSVGVEVEEEDD